MVSKWMVNKVPINEIVVGMEASYSQTITDADVKAFAGISGDTNPIHMDEDYATKSRYGKRIVHGLLLASFFSALFGRRLPGEGCVYATQSLKFKRPVYLGDTVTATVTVTDVDVCARKVLFLTVCKVNNKVVLNGNAEIFIPEKDGDKVDNENDTRSPF